MNVVGIMYVIAAGIMTKRKYANLRKSRRTPEELFKIVWLMFSGSTTAQIASSVNLPVQTVARNQHRIRHILFSLLPNDIQHFSFIYINDGRSQMRLQESEAELMFLRAHNKGEFYREWNALRNCLFKCALHANAREQARDAFQLSQLSMGFQHCHPRFDAKFSTTTNKPFKRFRTSCANRTQCKTCWLYKEKTMIKDYMRNPRYFGVIYKFFETVRIRDGEKFPFLFLNAHIYALFCERLLKSFDRSDIDTSITQNVVDHFLTEYNDWVNGCMRLIGHHTPIKFEDVMK